MWNNNQGYGCCQKQNYNNHNNCYCKQEFDYCKKEEKRPEPKKFCCYFEEKKDDCRY